MKNKENDWNRYDAYLKELLDILYNSYKELKVRVEDVIVKINVVTLYLDEEDKNEAKIKSENSKSELKKVMIQYEKDRKDFIDYFKLHEKDFYHCREWECRYPNSKDCVEKFYKEFYTK